MNIRLFLPLCAAAALLAACGQRDSTQMTSDEAGGSSVEPIEETPAPAMDSTDTVPGTTSTPATPESPSDVPAPDSSTPPDTTNPPG